MSYRFIYCSICYYNVDKNASTRIICAHYLLDYEPKTTQFVIKATAIVASVYRLVKYFLTKQK